MSARSTGTDVVLLVDMANVLGSRPDGWWRDRAGATTRALRRIAGLAGATVEPPNAAGPVRLVEIRAVVEGAARSAQAPEGVVTVRAARDGDSEVVTQAGRILAEGRLAFVVTADRGLRARLPAGTLLAGPGWLNRLLDR